MFGPGISAALSVKRITCYQWIADGIALLKDDSFVEQLLSVRDSDSSVDNLFEIVGRVLTALIVDRTYFVRMQQCFETTCITNVSLAETLQKLTDFNDVFVTTNYGLLLEKATGLNTLSYEQ